MSKTYSAGIVTAYGAAKRAGYHGTYEDFCRQQAQYAESAAAVEQAKNTAVSAASTATAKAREATTAATAAQTAKIQTEAAASQALTDISTARTAAISAVQTEGATQTANATAQAQAAATSATTASTKASEASQSATSAGQSATNAAASATSAANAASAAQAVLNSIPEDYSDLSEDVGQLKADLVPLEECFSNPNVMSELSFDNRFCNAEGLVRVSSGSAASIRFHVTPLTTYYLKFENAYNRRAIIGNSVNEFVTNQTYTFIASSEVDDKYGMTFTVLSGINYVMVYFYSGEYTYNASDFSLFVGNAVPEDTGLKLKENSLPGTVLTEGSEFVADVDSILCEKVDVTLLNPYFSGNNNANVCVKLGRFFDGGKLIISEYPATYRYGIREYETNNYSAVVSDTGWLQVAPYTLELNPNHYYFLICANATWTTIQSLDIINEFKLTNIVSKKTNVLMRSIQSQTVRSIAHRGDPLLAPQNTAPAYIIARKNGFTIGENDVCNSSDNEFVMWHDTTLSRLGNIVDINGYEVYSDGTTFYYYDSETEKLYIYDSGYVESDVDINTLTRCDGANYSVTGLPLAVLKRFDFGAYKGNQFKGTQILTFAEWIAIMKLLGMDCYIDRKIGYTVEIATQLANIVKSYGMLDHVSWIGVSSAPIIEAIRTVDPNARIGTLSHPTAENVVTYAPYNVGRGFFFDGNVASGFSAEVVAIGINAGFEVEGYYVDWAGFLSETYDTVMSTIKTAISYGVSGLTLDHYRAEDTIADMLDSY